MTKKLNIAIFGASGYTGVELIRILLNHPNTNIKSLIAESNAGKNISEIFPHLAPYNLPALIKFEDANFDDIQAVFLCLPHGTTQEVALKIPKNIKIIDVSADFRLKNPDDYEKYYHQKHKALELQSKAVYGLSEIYREEIAKADLIACPGCYPTSILLPLIPLLKNNLIEIDDIISDSKSGISGAGRKADANNLFTEVNENLKPYGIASHRHLSEIEQELGIFANNPVTISFTPQVIPISRGMISNIYVKNKAGVTSENLKECLQENYKNSDFVKIAEAKNIPTIKNVYSTNLCLINIFADRIKNRSIIISAIDNLTKGASGQAVQNFNITFGFDEKTALNLVPVFP
ncbi:MAG: N-acetyl-gamma-glutamyl-phosphate reductase [Rickettsiales bacterium]|nr:N-acetyl-gamma-glutamyl-phosphate reductase [Rickettsiales bacterium]